jgi:UDP:flavonoid glycosyltransferase YjiC (YdhE family)
LAHIAFVNVPARGHINPTLPVAAELTRRGDTVEYYVSEEMRDLVAPTDAVVRPYPAGYMPDGAAITSLLDDGNLVRVALMLLRATENLATWLIDQWTHKPTHVVVFDSTCVWAMIAVSRAVLSIRGWRECCQPHFSRTPPVASAGITATELRKACKIRPIESGRTPCLPR